MVNQFPISSVVIDAELDMEYYGSIPTIAIKGSWNHLIPELIPN
jgi:hypothetical protein